MLSALTRVALGSGISAEHFRDSITRVLAALGKRELPDPVFFVGRTGSRIAMLENVDHFDYTAAGSLPLVATEFGMGFKEHNAAYLSCLVLSLRPDCGITAANAGPNFVAAQAKALIDLAALEDREPFGKRGFLQHSLAENIIET